FARAVNFGAEQFSQTSNLTILFLASWKSRLFGFSTRQERVLRLHPPPGGDGELKGSALTACGRRWRHAGGRSVALGEGTTALVYRRNGADSETPGLSLGSVGESVTGCLGFGQQEQIWWGGKLGFVAFSPDLE
ncbi:hypothetical protein H1C71_017737, partial [Ictidomys tridecemlineatus]